MTVMRRTHLRHVELNLLLALQALLEERHVTRAAKRCFLSQPAMSRAVERLRETFGDQLLICSGRAHEGTVRGDESAERFAVTPASARVDGADRISIRREARNDSD